MKTNLVELLRDCPTGMELYSPLYDNCTLEMVFEGCLYPIQIQTPEGLMNLTKYGGMSQSTHSKCVIFPKGKTTWEGFVPPCKFKDGDVVAYDCTDGGTQLYICKEQNEVNSCCLCYLMLDFDGELDLDKGRYYITRLATEEEKQKLFDAIKANGYRWNAETKTLEKLVQPIFEVGNKIEKSGYRFTIAEVKDDYYLTKCGNLIAIANQDDFILVPNKFDNTTLKPFDKVLVRNTITEYWRISLFGVIVHDDRRYFMCLANSGFYQCIPYEHNEHLLGTANDCDDFYKTWEEWNSQT